MSTPTDNHESDHIDSVYENENDGFYGHSSDLKGSSWGRPPLDINSRALHQINRMLKSTDAVLEGGVLLLAISNIVALVWLGFFVNFGNVVFDDGTAFHCYWNGSSREVYAPHESK